MVADIYSEERENYGILGVFNIKKPLIETMSKDIDAGAKVYGKTPQKFLNDVRKAFRDAASLIRPSVWQITDVVYDKNRILDDKVYELFYYVLGDVIAEQNVVAENLLRVKQLFPKYIFLDFIPKSMLMRHGDNICFGCVQIRGYNGDPVMYEFDEKTLTEGYTSGGEGDHYYSQDKRALQKRAKNILNEIDIKITGAREFIVLDYGGTDCPHQVILFADGNAYIGDVIKGKKYNETEQNAIRSFAKLAHEDPKGFIMNLISGMTVEGPKSYRQPDPRECYGKENNNGNHECNNQSHPVDIADEILKWKQLLDCGAITQDEYDAKKKQLLNS